MTLRRINFIHVLIGAAFLLGLILRFINLGNDPLSDAEAKWALQALNLSRNATLVSVLSVVNPQPAYVVLTSWLFDFFGASNFMARFWPALTGSLLILLTALISVRASKIYQAAIVIMAFGLAMAPGLVASSRLAGSPIMAVSFLLLALGLYYFVQGDNGLETDRPTGITQRSLVILAGIIMGLALLSGTAIITGLLILGLTLAFTRLFLWKSMPRQPSSLTGQNIASSGSFTSLRKWKYSFAVVSLILTILLVGSSFFRAPQELAVWLETLPVYFQGWLNPSGIPIVRMLAALLFYQAALVIFGLAGAVRGNFFHNEETSSDNAKFHTRLCLAWIFIAGLVVLVYPARQTIDMIWLIVPFCLLAGWEIQHYLPQGRIHAISIVQALLLIVLMGLLWYSLASAYLLQAGDSGMVARYIVMLGIIALGILITILIQLGWSWQVARLGLAWGLFGGLALFTVSMLFGTAYFRSGQPQELWAPSPATGQAGLFLSTLRDLSNRNTGRPESIEIVSEVNNPSMRWLLRDFPNTHYVEQFLSGSALTTAGGDSRSGLPADLPSILITRATQETPATAAAYRGQDFTWWLYPGWQGALPQDLGGWLTYRKAPVFSESIILWARSDLFPGGKVSEIPVRTVPPVETQPETDPELDGGLND